MKRLLAVCAIMLFGILFVACSNGGGSKSGNSGNGGDGANTAAQNEPKETEQEAPPKEVTLKIGLPGSYDITDKAILDGFTAMYPHIKLEIDESPWGDFTQKITAQVAAGNAPDIWLQENAVILGYGHRGVAEDLTPYVERDLDLNAYSPQLLAAQNESGIWGIPHGLNPATTVYNKAMFDEAGIAYPTDDWTYEEFLDIARQLSQDTDGDGVNDVWGLNVTHAITTGWYPWSKIYGGGILDDSKTKAIVTDPKTIQGLEAWINTMQEGLAPTADQERAGGGSYALFADNRIAMLTMQYSSNARVTGDYPELDYDAVQMPIGYDGNRVIPNVINSWLIYSRASQEVKDAAWTFIKYYLSDEPQEILANSGASIPLKLSASQLLIDGTGSKPENKAAYVNGVNESGQTTDENHSWQEWRAAAQPVFQEMREMTKSVQEGAAEIQQKIQTVLDENP